MNVSRLLGTLLLAFALLPSGPASADDVEVRTEDGHVIAMTTVDVPLAAARALLGDPERLARIEGRGAEVSSRPQDGCIVSDIVAPSGVGDIVYTAMSCPVADGFEGSLVEGEKIREMRARWTLREEGGRVLIAYDLYAVPRIKVPVRLVALLSKRGVRRLLEAIRDELAREAAASS